MWSQHWDFGGKKKKPQENLHRPPQKFKFQTEKSGKIPTKREPGLIQLLGKHLERWRNSFLSPESWNLGSETSPKLFPAPKLCSLLFQQRICPE